MVLKVNVEGRRSIISPVVNLWKAAKDNMVSELSSKWRMRREE